MPYTRPLKFAPEFPVLNFADENGITNSTKGKTRDPSKERKKIKNPVEIAKIYSDYYQSKGSKYSRFFVCPSHTCYNSCNDSVFILFLDIYIYLESRFIKMFSLPVYDSFKLLIR